MSYFIRYRSRYIILTKKGNKIKGLSEIGILSSVSTAFDADFT